MYNRKNAVFGIACGILPALCAFGASSIASAATTYISGPNANAYGDGYYTATDGTYEVEANTSLNGYTNGIAFNTPPYATVTVDNNTNFNGNNADGASLVGTTFTDNGGTYSNNAQYGIYSDRSFVTLNDATVTGNQLEGAEFIQSSVTITGGEYGGNDTSGTASIPDILADQSNIMLYGNFGSDTTLSGNQSGTITGIFENDSVAETFSYELESNSSITFINTATLATPEPTSLVALMLGACGLAGLMLRRKRSQML